ncbi:MAG TPA: hypothetical protein VL463_18295 [Kofleriaceae bacterium]|jgi:hypothetical protein|nr:hypothetical protein [Kofleriaceae bacterium]
MLNTLYLHLRMVKLTAAATAAMALLVTGCMGEITNGADGDGTLTPEEQAAKSDFETNVLPMLNGFCGSCHMGMANVDFMKPEPDVRTRMLTWPNLINLDTPASSMLLNKGAHEGPAFTTDQQALALQWINLEKVAAGTGAVTIQTQEFQPVPGLNTVDLTPIGLTGSTLTFRLEPLSVGIYLNEITVHAGTDGAHVVHPLFVTYDEHDTASPDPVDRFSDVDLTVAAAAESPLGGGTAVFVNVQPTSKLSIHFKVAEKATGGGTTGGGGVVGGGCKAVAQFTQLAQPLLSQNCASCHAGANAGATSATDMTKINDLSPEGQAAACAQILTRVDKNTPTNSGIFVSTDPNQNVTHPFKFNGNAGAFSAFQTQLTMWINQEK